MDRCMYVCVCVYVRVHIQICVRVCVCAVKDEREKIIIAPQRRELSSAARSLMRQEVHTQTDRQAHAHKQTHACAA